MKRRLAKQIPFVQSGWVVGKEAHYLLFVSCKNS